MSRLIEELKKLPGVGTKSAQRFAFHILRSSDEDAGALAEAVRGLKASLRLCSICNNVTDVDPCAYCASPTRNLRLVCVVEEPTNIEAVERTRSYQGVYHVLHGTLSPLHGVGPVSYTHLDVYKRQAYTGLEHAAAPDGDAALERRIVHGDGLGESADAAELDIDDLAGLHFDGGESVAAIVNRLIETDAVSYTHLPRVITPYNRDHGYCFGEPAGNTQAEDGSP